MQLVEVQRVRETLNELSSANVVQKEAHLKLGLKADEIRVLLRRPCWNRSIR